MKNSSIFDLVSRGNRRYETIVRTYFYKIRFSEILTVDWEVDKFRSADPILKLH